MCHSRIVRADSTRGGTLPPCQRGGYAGVAFHPWGIDRVGFNRRRFTSAPSTDSYLGSPTRRVRSASRHEYRAGSHWSFPAGARRTNYPALEEFC